MPPRQSTIDTIAAALSGYTQGREMKRSRELQEEELTFQKDMALRQEKRAESQEQRQQREFTRRMLLSGFELAEAKSEKERSEKYEKYLQSMANDFGIPRELITEEAVKLQMDVEQSRASTAASKASTARSMAGLETERLQQEGIRQENKFRPIDQQLRKFGLLQGLGYEPAQSRVMEESGELLMQRPGARLGGTQQMNSMLDNLRQTMDRAVDLATKQEGKVPALNQVAEEATNRYFAMDYLLSGGKVSDFQPISGMDFSKKFDLDEAMQLYKDLNPTGFAGIAQTRPQFKEESAALETIVKSGLGELVGKPTGQGTVPAQRSASEPPVSKDIPLTEANVAWILETAADDSERKGFMQDFNKAASVLGRVPSMNELLAMKAKGKTQKSEKPTGQPVPQKPLSPGRVWINQ